MKVMKFEGSSMREAVAKVKAELGDQAVIVSTRQIRRGLLGTACEISAAIDDDDEMDARRGPRPVGANAYTASGSGSNPGLGMGTSTSNGSGPSDADLERMMMPLRGELKSLRALIRASQTPDKASAELRAEVALLRKLVEDMRGTPPAPPAQPARGSGPIATSKLTAPSTGRAIMLVGPTGVGKTTTIAKLAARAALIEGRRVQLITLDNYRVGGVDQIRTFADLIGVPLRVVASAHDLADAIDDNDDLTLIDTAGRSPRDTVSIRELADAIASAPPLETHLVIPAGSSAVAIEDIVNRYRPLNPARLLFTKLDEVDDAPELSRAPARLSLPVTWVTTGQAVPEDIEEPTQQRLLELAAAGIAAPRSRTNAA
jgi:flagellar biosynthesis protein FlhF